MIKTRIFAASTVIVLVVLTSVALAGGPDPLATVRRSTAHYQRIEVAEADGFEPLFECMEDDTEGAMGFHYANFHRFDSELELEKPEVLLYETGGRIEHQTGGQDEPHLFILSSSVVPLERSQIYSVHSFREPRENPR